MEFEIRSIDSALRGHGALPDNVKFTQSGVIGFQLRPQTLIGQDGLNAEAAARIGKLQETAAGIPYGTCELHNIHIVGPQLLIADTKNRIFWKGSLFNWSDPVFALYAQRYTQFHAGSAALEANPKLFRSPAEFGEAVLIGAPGFGIYGHWLIDYLPKLHELQRRGHEQLPFHYGVAPSWAASLAAPFLESGLPKPIYSGNRPVFFERLIIPTSIRSTGIFDETIAPAVWQRLSQALAATQGGETFATPPDKIYISRRKWARVKQERLLKNAEAVEQFFARAGFAVVSPETLPLAEQRRIFSRARIVVGEDGSGLHNTIFSAPGTRVGAISMGRINTLHLVVANALRQHITFIPTTAEPPAAGSAVYYSLDLAQAGAALEKLLHAP